MEKAIASYHELKWPEDALLSKMNFVRLSRYASILPNN